jgi:hypothetical protein
MKKELKNGVFSVACAARTQVITNNIGTGTQVMGFAVAVQWSRRRRYPSKK